MNYLLFGAAPVVLVASPTGKNHILAIDVLRGIVLSVMAFEHVAYYVAEFIMAETYRGIPISIGSWRGIIAGLLTNLAAPTLKRAHPKSVLKYI